MFMEVIAIFTFVSHMKFTFLYAWQQWNVWNALVMIPYGTVSIKVTNKISGYHFCIVAVNIHAAITFPYKLMFDFGTVEDIYCGVSNRIPILGTCPPVAGY